MQLSQKAGAEQPGDASHKFVVRDAAYQSGLILLVGTTSVLVVSLLVTVLLGRSLTPAEFGFFSVVATMVSLSKELVDLGTSNVATREIIKNPEEERNVLESLLGIRRVISLVLGIICAGFAFVYGEEGRQIVLYASAVTLYLLYLSAFSPVFQARQIHLFPTALVLASHILMLFACVLLVQGKAAGLFFAFLVLVREAIVLIGNWVIAIAHLGYWPRPKMMSRISRSFVGKALVIGICAMLYNVCFHGGTLFVWILRNEMEVGAYSAAFRPFVPILMLSWVFAIPLVPFLTEMSSNNTPMFRRQVESAICLFAGMGSIVAVLGVMLAPNVLYLLYGERFIGGTLSSVPTLRWLSLAMCFSFVVPVISAVLMAVDREKTLLKLSIMAVIVNVALNTFLLLHFDFYVVAVVTAVTQLFMCVSGYFLAKDVFDLLGILRRIGQFLLPAVLIIPPIIIWPDSSVYRVPVGGFLGLVAFLAVWFLPAARRSRQEQLRASVHDL